MTKIDDGGPAFPVPNLPNMHGMPLRDWFAGQALPAVMAVTAAGQHIPQMLPGETRLEPAIARDAYAMADAMLAVRNGGENG